MSMVPRADIDLVRRGRILFSHHSVGSNVLRGIDALDAAAGMGRLRIVAFDGSSGIAGPALVHGSGGTNGSPRSKIDAFARWMADSSGPRPDLALMKLCYVDFDPRTDVDGLFEYYRTTLERLKGAYPELRFGHVTVPLHERPRDLRSTVRRLLGREVWEDAANEKRNAFSRRLQEHFAADPIFDLALVEATGPDGTVSSDEVRGRRVLSLHPSYSADGGHLNERGQLVAGAAAIRFLAGSLPRAPGHGVVGSAGP
jgi:hypothetical protein